MAIEKNVVSFIEDIEATVERHGLPQNFSDVDKDSVIRNEEWAVGVAQGEDGHIGIYEKESGDYKGDEMDFLRAAFEYGNREGSIKIINLLDRTVPLENSDYTSFAFAIKQLFKMGYKYPKDITKTYLMKDESTGQTKIGKSRTPKRRERTLQAEKPTISLLYVCDYDVENELHKQYADKRTRGEWFALTDEDIMYICRNYNFYEYEDE